MGFFSHRRRDVEVRPEQKWDYISLNDFKSTSCFTPFAYIYLWFSVLLSLAVYAVDTFTAVNLLAFGKWSSTIEPSQMISFDVSKWIFSICIILSVVNLIYEHIRAQRIMRRGSVAECYLDNLAVRLESMRLGKGQGWRRFLVFAELTKSKKGAEYVALFTFFSFQSWVRVLLCSGPRQAINALTLYSIYDAMLSIEGKNFESSLMSFFDKLRALAVQEPQQTVVLCGMLFTLVIWVFSFLSLLLAALFFVFFLWHYIPKADGGLTGYCERKANKRLMKIVSIKINKAMADDERKRKKAELKAAKKNGELRPMSMQATIPDVGGDKLPEMPMLHRNDTMATLPLYTSRPGTPGSFEMNAVEKRPLPSRTGTMSSSTISSGTGKFSSRQPLVGAAADIETSNPTSPASAPPPFDLNNYPPTRTATSGSNRSFGSGSQFGRMPTNGSGYSGHTAQQSSYPFETMPSLPPPIRSPVLPQNNRGGPGSSGYPNNMQSIDRSGYDQYSGGRESPAPSVRSYRQMPQSPHGMGPGGYPVRANTSQSLPRGPAPQYSPRRNMTAPMQPRHQQTPSGSSLRNMATPYQQSPRERAYDYFDMPMSSSQQGGPRPGYGNGWNQDVERGQGPRY